MHALIDLAETTNADIANVVGRDKEGRVLYVIAFAEGDAADRLKAFLDGDSEADAAKEGEP
jgi:hypothetical protein